MTDFLRFIDSTDWIHWPGRIEQSTDAIRLFHGRGQCFPGFEFLTVDYFKPVLWLVLYRPPDEVFWRDFCDALLLNLAGQVDVALVQHRYDRKREPEVLWGDIPVQPVAVENGLQFALQIGERQNIGYFMDMAPVRRWLTERVAGKRVLNLFAYTCSFSVAAVAGGAASVVNIDMSKPALRIGRDNHQLNGMQGEAARVQYLGHDIFSSWGRLKREGPFDLVICDPPSRQVGSFDVRRDYPKLIRRMPQLVAAGGELLACLNAPYLDAAFLEDMVAGEWPAARFLERFAGRADFPEKNPQAALKVLRFQSP